MAEAVQKTNDSVTAAIDQLAVISRVAAGVLRGLKAETFERPYLDVDAIASLADSALVLRNLEDHAMVLFEATEGLRNLEDKAMMLTSATEGLGSLDTKTSSLQMIVSDLDSTVQRAAEISSEFASVNATGLAEPAGLAQNMRFNDVLPSPEYELDTRPEESTRWLYFKWGFGIGVALVVAIVITILVLMHHHSH